MAIDPVQVQKNLLGDLQPMDFVGWGERARPTLPSHARRVGVRVRLTPTCRSIQQPLLWRQAIVSPYLQLRAMRGRAAGIVQHQRTGSLVHQLVRPIAEIHEQPRLIRIAHAAPQGDLVAGRCAAACVVHTQAGVLVLDAVPAAAFGVHGPVLHRQAVAIPQLRTGVVGGAPASVIQTQRGVLHVVKRMRRTVGGQVVP